MRKLSVELVLRETDFSLLYVRTRDRLHPAEVFSAVLHHSPVALGNRGRSRTGRGSNRSAAARGGCRGRIHRSLRGAGNENRCTNNQQKPSPDLTHHVSSLTL